MTVRVSNDGPVTTVVIDRPEVRNAVDRPTAAALVEAFAEFESDPDARVAVLAGAGGTFCAGADLAAFGADGDRANRLRDSGDGPMGPTRMRLSKPVIAAIAGFAVAGGLELACWCDLRVAEQDAVFGVFCRRWGVPLIDGGTVRLPRLVGMSHALDMILTGRPVPADEAYRMGLANRLVATGTSLAAAQELAAQIAGFPQMALRGDRRSVYDQQGRSRSEALGREFAIGMAAMGEAREGALRFAAGSGRHGGLDDI